ncbi:hypothetical protein GCM10009117_08490 [Gangjinia marincola]|uniref:Phosphoenolpyruvate synthase n=1 Tax=Gangjinia marincola TaxID=578463 RepID=A0ABN1MEY5_9FLAO
MKRTTFYLFFLLLSFSYIQAQKNVSNEDIKSLIQTLKQDPRGPYFRIKWFCDDGTIRDPKDPCPERGGKSLGIQHATYRADVLALAEKRSVYFGQILSATAIDEFWNKKDQYSRLKQYQLGKYLESIDDGWILRKGQYYRGAVQIEDEKAWGNTFYKTILGNDDVLAESYYLIRQSLLDIPHNEDSNLAQEIRSQSKIIADNYTPFMDLRIKIHGNPDKSDIIRVENFYDEHKKKLPPSLMIEMNNLKQSLRAYYKPIDFTDLSSQLNAVNDSDLKTLLLDSFNTYQTPQEVSYMVKDIADLLCHIRTSITQVESPLDRLVFLDLSTELEIILMRESNSWQPREVDELLQKIYTLSLATAGTGLIELWEWETVDHQMTGLIDNNPMSIGQLERYNQFASRVVGWSAATVKATYNEVVDEYAGFEPIAVGFIDDRIRSSVALALGNTITTLSKFLNEEAGITNQVLDISDQSGLKGINPGYSKGVLHVVQTEKELERANKNDIYVFQKPPSDLKPVAGILSVSEGNLVSHVQLLARNLAIPNVTITDEIFQELKQYDGETVFLAVTDKGNVLMKLEKDMTNEEQVLFEEKQRNTEMVTVPINRINLNEKNVLSLREVKSSASGVTCGPKAANLGQLKQIFPNHVVEGIVIPFGIFRSHMDQLMPATQGSYWYFLTDTFRQAETMKNNGASEAEIQDFQLNKLAILREAILKMPLDIGFVVDFQAKFQKELGNYVGNVPVFLRSDTNMEDLEQFTGAGLNLTLFNVKDREQIMNGIKKVWASPYTERSFTWRQQYLTNPENVYPSILVIPSVDVDRSGVIITKNVQTGSNDGITVAFSRGAGGAVDGQAAETRIVYSANNQLINPSRQPYHNRLPTDGGTNKEYNDFSNPVLSKSHLEKITRMVGEVQEKMPQYTSNDYQGPWDIELGFKNDKLWLFQIRPFVENKNALYSTYLKSISPEIDLDKQILTTTQLN